METKPEVGTATPGGGEPAGTRRGLGGRTGALLVGAIVLGLVLAGLGWALWPDGEERVRVSAGENVAVTVDTDPVSAHNSPTLVASPVDARRLAVVARVDRPQPGAGVHVSADGGTTWTRAQLTLPPGQDQAFVPDVAFDGRGDLVALFATLTAPGRHPSGLWLERSRDGGGNFSSPVRVAGPYAYQPRLAVDPGSGAVHATWVQATSAVEALANGFGPPPNPVMMATSTDGGATFAEPVQVSSPERERVGAATPIVGPRGEVYVLYQDFGEDDVDFEGKPGPVYEGTFSLVLTRSSDGGRTFTEVAVVEPAVVPTERFSVYLPKFPSLAVDRGDGALYVTWSDARNDDWDVFLRRSDNSGRSWTRPLRVNDDPLRSGTHQYLPTVAVAPGGRVDVAFLDRRHDPANVLTAASLATSFDKGRTWRSVTVSDKVFDSNVGAAAGQQGAADPGSRLGLVSAREAAYVAWTDTRHGNRETGRQDLYFAPVRLVPE